MSVCGFGKTLFSCTHSMLHRDLSILNSGEQGTLHHADEFSSTFFFGSRCCMSKDVEILFPQSCNLHQHFPSLHFDKKSQSTVTLHAILSTNLLAST
jgi:hypothetical protein